MKLKTVYWILFAVLALSFGIVFFSAFSNVAAHTSAEAEASAPHIIIDAGHGGEDGGAEVDDVLEKNINLTISQKVADILRLSAGNTKAVLLPATAFCMRCPYAPARELIAHDVESILFSPRD